jgi:AcrR family transcriptional regulator
MTPGSQAPNRRPTRRSRLDPEQRRIQILDHARRLFGDRGYDEVTTAEIARQAGVTPALVHHYFGTKREIYLKLVGELAEIGSGLPAAADPTIPLRRRIAVNLNAFLDYLEANRETWLATAALGHTIADPEIRALIDRGREGYVDRIIRNYADVITDTLTTRTILHSLAGLNQAACRRWLTGQATRHQAERLLADALHTILTRTIPALTTESQAT